MIIRPATSEDAAALAQIINPIIRDTIVTFNSIEKPVSEIADRIGVVPHLVAQNDDKIVGYASFGPFRPGPGYARTAELSIAVAPAAHGQGVGRKLMLALEDAAKDAGIATFVACISAENTAARAFHVALGFAETGHLPAVGHKFGRDLDLVFAQKRL